MATTTPKRRQISVWLSIVGLAKIDELAADTDTDRSTVIRQLLAEALRSSIIVQSVTNRLRDRA